MNQFNQIYKYHKNGNLQGRWQKNQMNRIIMSHKKYTKKSTCLNGRTDILVMIIKFLHNLNCT